MLDQLNDAVHVHVYGLAVAFGVADIISLLDSLAIFFVQNSWTFALAWCIIFTPGQACYQFFIISL